jgi:ABC-2 type transport system permease protein
VGSKLRLTLLFYALFGLMVFLFRRQTVFTLSLYLHGMALAFLGMFVASSAGEILFNKEEGDILLHRPITPRALLWAKIGVLVEVSCWLAGAFNLAGFFVGATLVSPAWLFPAAHVVSTLLEALFCTGFVVLGYELCLRWFGRERLDGLMTMAQVITAIGAVLLGQVVPQLAFRLNSSTDANLHSWWIYVLPPAWFAGLDNLICGTGKGSSAALGGVAVIATATVLWLAFGRMALSYEKGLQSLNESSLAKPTALGRRRWLARLLETAPFNWWLRDSVSRASFLLAAAYLFRDRETKLRVYPGLAPMLVMPVIMLTRSRDTGAFAMALGGAYLGLVPLLGVHLLRYSQQWQAADVFRAAPIEGPAQLSDGLRRAVLFCLGTPVVISFVALCWLFGQKTSHLFLLLPGLIAMPVFAMVACLGESAVPLSLPTEESKAAGRGLIFLVATAATVVLAAVVTWAWSAGWFAWLILAELIIAMILYTSMRATVANARWSSLE